MTRVFRDPKFDNVVLLPEPEKADGAQPRDDQAEDDVPVGVPGDPLAVVVEEAVHRPDDEVLDGSEKVLVFFNFLFNSWYICHLCIPDN